MEPHSLEELAEAEQDTVQVCPRCNDVLRRVVGDGVEVYFVCPSCGRSWNT